MDTNEHEEKFADPPTGVAAFGRKPPFFIRRVVDSLASVPGAAHRISRTTPRNPQPADAKRDNLAPPCPDVASSANDPRVRPDEDCRECKNRPLRTRPSRAPSPVAHCRGVASATRTHHFSASGAPVPQRDVSGETSWHCVDRCSPAVPSRPE